MLRTALFTRRALARRAFTSSRAAAFAADGSSPSDNGGAFADFLPVVPPECLRVQAPTALSQRPPGPSSFTEMFRMMSPYINFHRGSTMVLHLPGQLVDSPLFSAVMQDIALLNTFGVKLVLVAGSRPQLNHQLALRQLSQRFDCGMRITGPEELKCAMDAAGSVRFQIESFLGRGIVNAPGRARAINVASGNFITAQPVGVRGGVDFKNTGEMRRLNTTKVREALDNGDIVLISSIGYSASGEVFNCVSEQVASKCAVQLQSDKLIFLHDGEELIDTRTNQKVQALIIQQAQQYVEIAGKDPNASADFLMYLKQSILACVNGVTRSHLVSRNVDGGLLQELFTRDGEGLMITKHMYEGVRMAKTSDIVSIMRLIQPLLDEDVLVSRNQEQIESNVHTFAVVERDGAIIACAALQPYENNFAEMACVAVDPAYRNLGKVGECVCCVWRRKASDSRSCWWWRTGQCAAGLHLAQGALDGRRQALRANDAHIALVHGARIRDCVGGGPAAVQARQDRPQAPVQGLPHGHQLQASIGRERAALPPLLRALQPSPIEIILLSVGSTDTTPKPIVLTRAAHLSVGRRSPCTLGSTGSSRSCSCRCHGSSTRRDTGFLRRRPSDLLVSSLLGSSSRPHLCSGRSRSDSVLTQHAHCQYTMRVECIKEQATPTLGAVGAEKLCRLDLTTPSADSPRRVTCTAKDPRFVPRRRHLPGIGCKSAREVRSLHQTGSSKPLRAELRQCAPMRRCRWSGGTAVVRSKCEPTHACSDTRLARCICWGIRLRETAPAHCQSIEPGTTLFELLESSDSLRSHAFPENPVKQMHLPTSRSQIPIPEHSSNLSCAVTESDGIAAHESPDGQTPAPSHQKQP